MVAAVARADSVAHPHTQAYVAYYSSVLFAFRREPVIARAHAMRCSALSEEHGFRQWRSLSRALVAICTSSIDPAATGLDEVSSELDALCRAGYQVGITAFFALLCEALLLRREFESAMAIAAKGLSIVSRNSERLFEAELHRLSACASLAQEGDAIGRDVGRSFQAAINIARGQRARSLELRATTSLARFWRDQGLRTEAHDLLAPIYGWFTEGFGTSDLKDAKALLDELA
jgi:predicted ATPase